MDFQEIELDYYEHIFPPLTVESLRKYIEERKEPCSFVKALLCNDFVKSFSLADHKNKPLLHEYARWLKWEIPSKCWGSEEIVNNWINEK